MPGTVLTSIHELINLILTTTPDEKTKSEISATHPESLSWKGAQVGFQPQKSVSRAHTFNSTLQSHL